MMLYFCCFSARKRQGLLVDAAGVGKTFRLDIGPGAPPTPDKDSLRESIEPSGRSVGLGSEEFQLTPKGPEGIEGFSGTACWSIEAEFSTNFTSPPQAPDRFYEDSLASGFSDDSSSKVDEENEQVGGVQLFVVADRAAPVADLSFLGGMSPVDRSQLHMQMTEKLERFYTPEETACGIAGVEAKKASAEIIQLSSDLGRERQHVKVLTAESSKKDVDISDLLRENERLRSVVSEASEQVKTLFLQNAALRDTLGKAKISIVEGEAPIFQAKPPLVKKPSRKWSRSNSLRWRQAVTDYKDMSKPSSPLSSKLNAALKETQELQEPQEEPEVPSSPCH